MKTDDEPNEWKSIDFILISCFGSFTASPAISLNMLNFRDVFRKQISIR